jgi:WD40 repeat protein
LVDDQGRPVAGARVSTYFERDRDRSRSFSVPDPIKSRVSDANGEATLELEIPGHLDGAGVYATLEQEEPALVGIHNVTRDEIGKPITIRMQRPCKLRLRVELVGYEELAAKYDVEIDPAHWWRAAYVMLGTDNRAARPLFTSSTDGALEFLLPPGNYTITAYGRDAGSVWQPVEIGPGHRIRSLDKIEVRPNKEVQQGIFRDYHHWTLPAAADAADDAARKPRMRPVRGFGPKGDAQGTSDIAFSPDGKLLATAHCYNADPGEVKLWDAQTGAPAGSLPAPAGSGGVLRLAFAPNGALLAGSIGDVRGKLPGAVVVWDVGQRREVQTFPGNGAHMNALAFAHKGKMIAVGASDRTVRLYDLDTGEEAGRIEGVGSARELLFTLDDKGLVVASGQTVQLWDVPKKRVRAVLDPGGFRPCSLSLTPDGTMLAAAGSTPGPKGQFQENEVRLYDLAADPPAQRLHLVPDMKLCGRAVGPVSIISSAAFTPDGRRVVAVVMQTVVTWDALTGAQQDFVERSTGNSAERIALSPDGRYAATTGAFRPEAIDITPPEAR